MSDNHYAPARVADNAGRAQVIGARFVPDYTLTPTASSVWSAWNTGFTVSGDWLALGAYVKILAVAGATLAAFIQHQLATGAAGSEVPFAVVTVGAPGMSSGISAGTAFIGMSLSEPIGPTLIPAGTRIAHRATLGAAAGAFRFTSCLSGYDGGNVPLLYDLYGNRSHLGGIHKAQSKVAPAAASLNVLSVSGAYGNWVEVIAAAASDLLVWGAAIVYANLITVPNMVNAQFGTGANPNEVARAHLPLPMVMYCSAAVQTLRYPLLVKAGERLVMRLAEKAAAHTWECNVFYEEL